MGHSFRPEFVEKALHYAMWHCQIMGEHFNVSPENTMLAVQRMQAAEQAFAPHHGGNGELLLFCGRENYPTDYYVPTDVANNRTDAGWVYGLSHHWGVDGNTIQAMVNEGPHGLTYGLTQPQFGYLTTMLQITKIGSATDLNARLAKYAWATCLTGSFWVSAAWSVRQRPDERERQREILGFLAGAQSGSRPSLQNVHRHISGEWMRCTPHERRQVRVRTSDAPHNQGRETREFVYTRGPLQLEVSSEELDAYEHWGLITNSERERNRLHYNENLVHT